MNIHPVPPGTTPFCCRHCGRQCAQVAVLDTAGRTLIDAVPHPDGDQVLVEGAIHQLPPDALREARGRNDPLYRLHYPTCERRASA